MGRGHDLHPHPEYGFVDGHAGLELLHFSAIVSVYNVRELDSLLPCNVKVEPPPVLCRAHRHCVAGEADLPLLPELGLSVKVQ